MRRIYIPIIIVCLVGAFYLGRRTAASDPVQIDRHLVADLERELGNAHDVIRIQKEHIAMKVIERDSVHALLEAKYQKRIDNLTHFYENQITALTGATASELDSFFTARYPERLKFSNVGGGTDSDIAALESGVDSQRVDTWRSVRLDERADAGEDRLPGGGDRVGSLDREGSECSYRYDAGEPGAITQAGQPEGGRDLAAQYEAGEEKQISDPALGDSGVNDSGGPIWTLNDFYQ